MNIDGSLCIVDPWQMIERRQRCCYLPVFLPSCIGFHKHYKVTAPKPIKLYASLDDTPTINKGTHHYWTHRVCHVNRKLEMWFTLGPRGPFLQSGVEVVSQLAHLRARRESPLMLLRMLLLFPLLVLVPPREPLIVVVWGGGIVFLVWKISQIQEVLDRPLLIEFLLLLLFDLDCRVEGVPRERVQSTEDDDGVGYW